MKHVALVAMKDNQLIDAKNGLHVATVSFPHFIKRILM